MAESAKSISYRTFRKYADGLDEIAKNMGYELRPTQGLTLKNDWHVAYFKGVYDKNPCVFMVHSCIEYIWI